MDRRSIASTSAFVFLCLVAAPTRSEDPARSEDHDPARLLSQYEMINQKFVDGFRASSDTNERFTLIRQASKELNAILLPIVDQPSVASVLPNLVHVKLIDLQPTFVAVIDDHPDPRVRALALLSFAEYSGNNERLKTSQAALTYLKDAYARLPYKDMTFGEAADEALYFYTNLAIGCEAPSTVGEDADGAVFKLSDYRGKVVMLRFWGNWCPACRRMYGFERELVNKYRNQPFALIGVNSDSREVCQRAQRESNLMWRSVWDGGNTHGPVASVYRVEQWPTIIVIDAEGNIRYRTEGLDERKLTRMLDRLISEASSEAAQ